MTVKYRKGDLQGNTDYMSRIEQVNITREMCYISSINYNPNLPPHIRSQNFAVFTLDNIPHTQDDLTATQHNKTKIKKQTK